MAVLKKLQDTAALLGLLGALKLIAQYFGLDIPDEVVNSVANGISGAAAGIAVVITWINQKRSQKENAALQAEITVLTTQLKALRSQVTRLEAMRK